MANTNTIMNQILKFIPRHEFQSCVHRFNGDKKIRHLNCWSQFVSMLFGQLTQRKSLRDLSTSLLVKIKNLYHWGIKPVHFTTLARANENRSCTIYETFFNKLYQKLLTIPRSHGFRFKNLLYAFDSTTIDLCLSLFSWAPFEKNKAAIKVHTLLNLEGNIPEFVSIHKARIHELQIAHLLKLSPKSIVTFDRGYEDYSLYQKLNDQNVFFVTRSRKNRNFKVLQRCKTNKNKGILADQTFLFNRAASKPLCPIQLRRIVFKDPESHKRLVFVTNIFHLSASTIAQIYKARWQIELFFKWIKQNLKIKSFLGTSENAVKTQIWIALIAYLLIFWLKHLTRTSLSMMCITRLLSLNLMSKFDLISLLNHDFKPSDVYVKKKQLSFTYI